MQQIKDTVEKVFSEYRKKRASNKEITRVFRQVFSKTENKHMRFISCKNGVCVINVDTSSWLYHLNFKKEQIKEVINKKLEGGEGIQVVEEIRFRIGEV